MSLLTKINIGLAGFNVGVFFLTGNVMNLFWAFCMGMIAFLSFEV